MCETPCCRKLTHDEFVFFSRRMVDIRATEDEATGETRRNGPRVPGVRKSTRKSNAVLRKEWGVHVTNG